MLTEREMLYYWFRAHNDITTRPQLLSCYINNFIDHIHLNFLQTIVHLIHFLQTMVHLICIKFFFFRILSPTYDSTWTELNYLFFYFLYHLNLGFVMLSRVFNPCGVLLLSAIIMEICANEELFSPG